MLKPYRSRVRIIAAEDESHYYTVDAETAAEIVGKGLATDEPTGVFSGYTEAIRLTVSTSELREHVYWRLKRRKRRPDLRAPQSSSGGGDQGLAPLVGGPQTALHYALGVPRV